MRAAIDSAGTLDQASTPQGASHAGTYATLKTDPPQFRGAATSRGTLFLSIETYYKDFSRVRRIL